MKKPHTLGVLVTLSLAAVLVGSSFSSHEVQSQTARPITGVKPVLPVDPVPIVSVPRMDPVPRIQTAPAVQIAPSIEPAPQVQSAPRVETAPTVIVPGSGARAERESPDCTVHGFACTRACDPLPERWTSYRACLKYECKQIDENCLEKLARQLDSQIVGEVTFSVECKYQYKVQIEFYSQNRSVAWPGNDKAYDIDDYETHVYKLKCNSGENICYGAWTLDGSKYWGVGMNDRFACDNCCVTCNGKLASYTLQ